MKSINYLISKQPIIKRKAVLFIKLLTFAKSGVVE